ncbi:hypothetical protein V6N13_053980 [Hibiscus sabdariffa]|uniref:Uncharacterized protein n=1 Tax=Hibiscus sabdariffa TaxID=183260 RepID=A0ABR2T5Z4_9ROSI
MDTGVNQVHNSAQTKTNSELFGPWMVVKDRRRRSVVSKDTGRISTGVGSDVPGSQFAVLCDEQAGDRMVADVVENNQGMDVQMRHANSHGERMPYPPG